MDPTAKESEREAVSGDYYHIISHLDYHIEEADSCLNCFVDIDVVDLSFGCTLIAVPSAVGVVGALHKRKSMTKSTAFQQLQQSSDAIHEIYIRRAIYLRSKCLTDICRVALVVRGHGKAWQMRCQAHTIKR